MRTPFGLFDLSAPESRRPGAALVAGVVGGFTGAAVKMGWEALFPPREPGRDLQPEQLLKQRGLDPDDLTYSYNGNDVPWGILAVHFGFSVATVTAYSVVAEYLPRTKLWGGIAYGLGAWVVAHEILLPRMKLTPPVSQLHWQEQVSELLGHVLWMADAEAIRHAVRAGIAGVPDADTRANAVARLADTARAAVRR